MPMRIALDYDRTYTEDPAFWDEFIRMCRARGHEVRIVTARNEHHDMTGALHALSRRIVIHWCRGVAKKWWMSHFGGGWIPTIWIEDKPEAVLENSPFSPEGLVQWRAERGEGLHYGRTSHGS